MDVDDPSTSRSPPADIPLAPAPWVLKTKLYLFATVLKPVHPEDPILQGLPPGSYNPSETIHPSALAPVNGAPQWKGGLTSVVIVRYEESPVGPYDELIMTSDGFANPYEKGTSGRITNIYVSTRDSVWNGRKNWNIQKHLARFEFIPKDSKTSCVKVFLPDAEVPFFSASITDSSIPGVPIPSFVLNPFMRIVQPPLLASDPPDIEIATNDEWISIIPVYSGRWRLAYIRPSEGGDESYGDGLHYPRIKPFWIGAKFTGSIHFPDGVKVKSKVE
ncbi:hypothetical protein DFH94DRAFT_690141 [Russula ochroleuca]|jgi:hypothetical protein|uniref:Uncharacterized protein n=1 Tax=Russula ochroleuca TaxID=152965 RepID=A0A9P5TC11_9AGAM|nr:hypothetical protein DFH94DRAFT_690141 [Russula ochroleuca]